MANLSPIPYRVPIVMKGGLIDRNWQQWFEALLARIGGAGDIDLIADLEALVTAEAAMLHVRLTAIEKALADQAMLEVFAEAPTIIEESSDVFEGATVSQVATLQEALHDLEALTIFSW